MNTSKSISVTVVNNSNGDKTVRLLNSLDLLNGTFDESGSLIVSDGIVVLSNVNNLSYKELLSGKNKIFEISGVFISPSENTSKDISFVSKNYLTGDVTTKNIHATSSDNDVNVFIDEIEPQPNTWIEVLVVAGKSVTITLYYE